MNGKDLHNKIKFLTQIKNSMFYPYVANIGAGIKSPLDG